MFCVTETLCFDVRSLVILGIFLLFLFGLLGYLAYRYFFPSEEDEGIPVTNMEIQKIETDVNSSGVDTSDYEEEDYSDKPYDVDKEVFAGEYLDFGVKLKILFYINDDEKTEVHCKPIIEAPAGATNITTDHTWEGDYGLGMAIIHFTDAGGNAQHLNIGLSDEALEDCEYTVVIESTQSTFENITE